MASLASRLFPGSDSLPEDPNTAPPPPQPIPVATGNIAVDRAIGPVTAPLPAPVLQGIQAAPSYSDQVYAGLKKALPYVPGGAFIKEPGRVLDAANAVAGPTAFGPAILGKTVKAYVDGRNPQQSTNPLEGTGTGDVDLPLQTSHYGTQLQNAQASQDAQASADAEAQKAKDAMKPTMVAGAEHSLVDPKRQLAHQEAFKKEQDAIADMQNSETAVGDAESNHELSKAAGLQTQATALEQAGKDKTARADLAKAQADDMRGKIDTFSAKVYQESKEDPDRWWNNQSTANKSRFVLGAFLGGAAQGHNGGQNTAIESMKSLAHADIEAQRHDYEHGRDRLGDMNSLYGMAMHATNDHDAAMDLATKWHLEGISHQADAMAASTGSQVSIAKAGVLRSALGIESAKVGQKAVEAGIKENKYVAAHMVPGAGAAGANGAGGTVDWKMQGEYGKQRHAAGLDSQEARIARLRQLKEENGGVMPGTDTKSRLLWSIAEREDEHGNPTAAAMVARNMLSPEAIEADNLYTGVGEGLAKASGQRGTEAIKLNKRIVHGTRSAADIDRGLKNAEDVFSSEEKNIGGQVPLQQSQYNGMGRSMAPVSQPFRREAPPQRSETPDGFEEE